MRLFYFRSQIRRANKFTHLLVCTVLTDSAAALWQHTHQLDLHTNCDFSYNKTNLTCCYSHTQSTYYIGMNDCPRKFSRDNHMLPAVCRNFLLLVFNYTVCLVTRDAWWYLMMSGCPRCTYASGDVMCSRMWSAAAWSCVFDSNLCRLITAQWFKYSLLCCVRPAQPQTR